MAVVVPYAGLSKITAVLAGISAALPKYLGWGTGSGTSSRSDTSLFTEDMTGGYARAVSTMSQQTTTQSNDTWQAVATLTAGAILTITNAGFFDAATAGNMALKGDFTGVPLGSGDAMQITGQIQFN